MKLRPMKMEDADFLLELKNYEETRKFSIATNDEIKRDDHLRYLEDNLQYFQVIIGGGFEDDKVYRNIRCGAIRIKDNEISIWIHKLNQKQGLATWVLEMVSEKGNIARIVDGNIFSMRAFINAGFKPIAHEHNYYILKK